MFGRVVADLVRLRRGILFTVDLDPRWVRRCLAEGRTEEAERYTEHLVDQAEAVLTGQRVDVLVATPPLLERLARRPALVAAITENVRAVLWGGASLDPDHAPAAARGGLPRGRAVRQYGSTTILGGAMERPSAPGEPVCVFDPFSPRMTFSVVDPATGRRWPTVSAARWSCTTSAVSLLLPNNLERDLATRIAAPPGVPGCSVADVAPVSSFQNTRVIEGVY